MKVLCVLAHPKRDSFTGTLMDRFVDGLTADGHEAEIADLYREGFDPVYSAADFAEYRGAGPLPDDVRREQERMAAADGLALFFPLWWWSAPAILKGWIDRVFRRGFAIDYVDGKAVGTLRHKKAIMVSPAAADRDAFRRYGYHDALRRQIDTGVFGYCGIRDVETFVLPDVDSDPRARAAHLERAYEIGRDFATTSGLDSRPLG